MPDDEPPRCWLLLIYKVPQDPPGHRTYVWRHLKQLGAVYLQQAAAILPDCPGLRVALEALAARVRSMPGEVSLLGTASSDPDWERELVARFNAARGEEYAEVAENVERFEDEIRRETRKGKFTFAELEDAESDWEKIQRWHERVVGRDFFDAPGRADAEAALARGHAELQAFAAAVYRHAGVQGNADTANPGR